MNIEVVDSYDHYHKSHDMERSVIFLVKDALILFIGAGPEK